MSRAAPAQERAGLGHGEEVTPRRGLEVTAAHLAEAQDPVAGPGRVGVPRRGEPVEGPVVVGLARVGPEVTQGAHPGCPTRRWGVVLVGLDMDVGPHAVDGLAVEQEVVVRVRETPRTADVAHETPDTTPGTGRVGGADTVFVDVVLPPDGDRPLPHRRYLRRPVEVGGGDPKTRLPTLSRTHRVRRSVYRDQEGPRFCFNEKFN